MQTIHGGALGSRTPEAHARHDDLRTSHIAAHSLSRETLTEVQRAVGAVLAKHGPMTDAALIEKYRELQSRQGTRLPQATDSSIRTRRKELVDALKVFECGKVTSESGRPTTLWGVRRPGRQS